MTGSWRCARSTCAGTRRPVRSIVALSTRGAQPGETTLLEGHDFFGSPRVDPNGDRLAVVVWDHPDMPWDASAVVVVPLARVARATPGPATLEAVGAAWLVAGGPGESVGQPAWARDGSLRFVSDRRGWWQPYAHPGRPDPAEATALTDVAAEFHGPDWVLGQTTMAEVVDGTVVARMTASGRDVVGPIGARPSDGGAGSAPAALCLDQHALCAHADGLAFIGSTPDAPANVWVWTPDGVIHPLRPPPDVVLGSADVAPGEPFTLRGRSGRPVHGTLYRPTRHGTTGPVGLAPPLVTWCHGGPTSSCPSGFDLTLQFFTTRGFAVACVDYAGSTGYGRRYRCALVGPVGRRRRRGLPRRGAVPRGALATSTQTA